MPKEVIHPEEQRQGPAEVYCTLRDLIGLQYDIQGFSFLPGRQVQSILSGRHASRLRGRGLDFDEVRKYAPGDDIRNIDWRVTARTGETYTKVFTEEKERPVLIIVDQSSSMFFGSRLFFKSVIAAHLAALAAWRVLSVDDRVGGIVFNDEGLVQVAPKRDRRAVQRFLSIITEKNNALQALSSEEGASAMLNKALYQANQTVTHDFLICLISDFRKADKQSFKEMITLARHNDIIAFQVSDPMERQLPDTQLTVTDGRYQTLAPTGRKWRNRLAAQQQQKQQWLAEQLKKYKIPLVSITTAEEATGQLRRQIGTRMKAGR